MLTYIASGRAYRPDSNGRQWLKGGWWWLKRKGRLMFVALYTRDTHRDKYDVAKCQSKHSKNNYINFTMTYPRLNPRALWMGPKTSGYETADRETRFEVSLLSSL